MNALQYRGYAARIEFDAEDRLFVGRLAGINDVIGFHAETMGALEAAFHEAVDDYIASCATLNKEPERAYSGKVMFRIPPETHAKAALAAQLSGKSLNQWAADVLEAAVHKERITV